MRSDHLFQPILSHGVVSLKPCRIIQKLTNTLVCRESLNGKGMLEGRTIASDISSSPSGSVVTLEPYSTPSGMNGREVKGASAGRIFYQLTCMGW